MTWLQMDISDMGQFSEASFDLVIEKATLDAMYTGPVHLIGPTVREIFRVLRPGGHFVSISFGPPAMRKDLFRLGWAARNQTPLHRVGDSEGSRPAFFVYAMRKPGVDDPETNFSSPEMLQSSQDKMVKAK